MCSRSNQRVAAAYVCVFVTSKNLTCCPNKTIEIYILVTVLYNFSICYTQKIPSQKLYILTILDLFQRYPYVRSCSRANQ